MSQKFTNPDASPEHLISDTGPAQPRVILPHTEKTHGMDLKLIRHLWASVANLLGALLVFIISSIDFIPFEPGFPANSLDSGWQFALNAAMAKGLVFGRDIIFTFGPYASIYTQQYHPAINTQMLWSGGLLAIAFAASLTSLTQGVQRLIAVGFTVFLVLVPRDTLFFAIPFVALLLIYRLSLPSDHPAWIAPTILVRLTLALLVVALSLLTLVKGSFAIASGTVLLLGCVLLVARGHKRLAMSGALLFVMAMSILWVLAGQPLGRLPDFFLAQEPIISGYTAAMSSGGPPWQIVLFVGCCLAFGRLNVRHLYSAGIAGFVLLVGSTALIFLAFKEGFVRDDAHSLTAGGMLGVTGWLLLLLGRKGVIPLVGLLVGLTGWSFIDHSEIGGIEAPFIAAENGLMTRLMDPSQLKQTYANSLITIQTEQPLPKLAGTTDIYSYGQSALLANGLDWAPRPVLQSYSAYTPSLARKDADYLAGADAPKNIFFAVQPIDNRLPALEDGASWPELLTRYDIIGLQSDAFGGDMAVLRRRVAPPIVNAIADIPSVSGAFRLDELIALPKNTPVVWAQVDVRPTLLGELIALLFKPPHLSISYIFPDGSKKTFQYVAAMGVSGFVAAPVIQNTTDFGALALPNAANYFAGRQPAFLAITADHGAGWLWRTSFTAQFFAMHIPVQPGVSRLLFSPLETEPERTTKLPTTSDCSIDTINQNLVVHGSVSSGDFIRVAGWAAISRKDGIAPDSTKITLTAPDGTVVTAQAKKIAREDVNRYFDKPNMDSVGYVASLNLSSLSGNYMLGLEVSRGGRNLVCTAQIPIHVGDSPGRRLN